MANPLDFWKRMLYWLICVEQFSPPCLSAPPFLFLTQTPLILHLLQIPDAHDCLLACHSKCKIMSCQEHKARIHSNSNWLTEHTEPNVDWETSTVSVIPYVNLAPLVVRCRHWLDLGFRDFVIENVCQNVMQHPIPDSRRKPLKILVLYIFISFIFEVTNKSLPKSQVLNTLGISARIRRDCLASNSLWCSHWPGHPILVMYPSVNGVTVEWVCIVWIIKTYQNKKSSLAIWILLLHGFNRILCCVCNHIGSHTRTQNCDVQTHSGLWCCACGKGLAPDV